MNFAYIIAGIFLITIVAADFLWTTLWVEKGAGPLTSRMMTALWNGLRRIGVRHSWARTLAGPLIVLVGLVMWISLLWIGWTFVFAGAENAVRDTIDGGPISWVERFYFVGYSLFTLGNGEFVPRDGVWQVATAFTTASGMLLITLSISYVIAVLDAVAQKRSFATSVSGLGSRGETVVTESWNGDSFDGVELPLNTFTSELNELTTNHGAYPVLHYFYSEQQEAAAVVSIVVLDEALTLWRFGVPEEHQPSRVVVSNARAALQQYLETLGQSFVTESETVPPSPDLCTLREAGIPTVSEDVFSNHLDDLEARRRALLGVVEADARQWPRTHGNE
ncbi:ion channel [Halobium palmae]|uniref:Ion channel n=1 Tax=Halobium palmae TaxID=1776492 RepID=A0ABD5RUA5_9EURY